MAVRPKPVQRYEQETQNKIRIKILQPVENDNHEGVYRSKTTDDKKTHLKGLSNIFTPKNEMIHKTFWKNILWTDVIRGMFFVECVYP